MDKEKVAAGLQTIVTGLSQQADSHQIQALIFEDQGYTKLKEKYEGHAEEERGNVGVCATRLLDLGCEVKVEAKEAIPVYTDPIEWLKYDLQVSKDGLAWLKDLTEEARSDYKTFDILKAYYEDEEEDMLWGETQLELIEKIGVQNWLTTQE